MREEEKVEDRGARNTKEERGRKTNQVKALAKEIR